MKIYKVIFFNAFTGDNLHETYFLHESSAKIFLKKYEEKYKKSEDVEAKGYMGEAHVFTEKL